MGSRPDLPLLPHLVHQRRRRGFPAEQPGSGHDDLRRAERSPNPLQPVDHHRGVAAHGTSRVPLSSTQGDQIRTYRSHDVRIRPRHHLGHHWRHRTVSGI